jgi:signal transduction histidine kinase
VITPAHKRALNRALHELRRPLQALVLLEERSGQPAASPPAASRRGLLEVAASALKDLDGAVNGETPRPQQRFSCREVVLAALERWRPVAARAGGIRVYWDAGPAPIEGDAARMAQALDNLISNALEHGGPPVVLTAARVAGRIRITIANGAQSRTPERKPDPRRGHGTDVVSRVASAHRGRFALCETRNGCVAALELPLAERGYALTA